MSYDQCLPARTPAHTTGSLSQQIKAQCPLLPPHYSIPPSLARPCSLSPQFCIFCSCNGVYCFMYSTVPLWCRHYCLLQPLSLSANQSRSKHRGKPKSKLNLSFIAPYITHQTDLSNSNSQSSALAQARILLSAQL